MVVSKGKILKFWSIKFKIGFECLCLYGLCSNFVFTIEITFPLELQYSMIEHEYNTAHENNNLTTF